MIHSQAYMIGIRLLFNSANSLYPQLPGSCLPSGSWLKRICGTVSNLILTVAASFPGALSFTIHATMFPRAKTAKTEDTPKVRNVEVEQILHGQLQNGRRERISV